MKYLLGIDQGTTQTTAVIVNELGEMVEKNLAQLPVRFPQADWAALEGRSAARSIARFLENVGWNGSRLEVHAEPPLDWICPNVLNPDALPSRFRLRSHEFHNHVTLKVMQGQKVLYSQKFRRLIANTSINLSGEPLKMEAAGQLGV